MSKKQSTTQLNDEFVQDTKNVFEEILGRELGEFTIGGCIDGEDFEYLELEDDDDE